MYSQIVLSTREEGMLAQAQANAGQAKNVSAAAVKECSLHFEIIWHMKIIVRTNLSPNTTNMQR